MGTLVGSGTLSGCSGLSSSTDQTPVEATDSITETPTTETSTPENTEPQKTPTPDLDCPPQLTVFNTSEEEVTENQEDIVSYQQLSDKRKQEFERALEHDSVELNATSDAWVATDVVRYQDQYYTPAVAVC
jgi:hypothetical protein